MLSYLQSVVTIAALVAEDIQIIVALLDRIRWHEGTTKSLIQTILDSHLGRYSVDQPHQDQSNEVRRIGFTSLILELFQRFPRRQMLPPLGVPLPGVAHGGHYDHQQQDDGNIFPRFGTEHIVAFHCTTCFSPNIIAQTTDFSWGYSQSILRRGSSVNWLQMITLYVALKNLLLGFLRSVFFLFQATSNDLPTINPVGLIILNLRASISSHSTFQSAEFFLRHNPVKHGR